MTTSLIIQCALGTLLGLLLHTLKKAKEAETTSGQRVTVFAYIKNDPKEVLISLLLAVILVVGLPELTTMLAQVLGQVFSFTLPPLQRTFFVCALLGGFGNSLADIVASYFGGERLKRFTGGS